MKIWLFLKSTFGFMGAVGFLYCGLGVSIILALYFIFRCFKNYYCEEG